MADNGQHITDAELASYLDRTLAAPARDRIESHLAECADCRRHLLETEEVLKRVRRPRKSLIAAGLVSAAVVVLVVSRRSQELPDQSALLRGDNEAAPIVAYAPIGSATTGAVRFIWGSTPEVESYRLTVSRADAATIWSSSGTDTVVSLPDSVTFRSGQQYHWVVDALLRDGTSRSTGLRQFTVGR